MYSQIAVCISFLGFLNLEAACYKILVETGDLALDTLAMATMVLKSPWNAPRGKLFSHILNIFTSSSSHREECCFFW